MIPYGHQDITQEDISAVQKILESDFLTQGPAVAEFEAALCQYTKAQYAVAVNSATSALHLACLALGLSQGDLVWTSPNTFVASANCALYCGADIDFVDIDPNTLNMSCTQLEKKLAAAQRVNRLPKILIPVHFAGRPTEQKKIWELAQKYDIRIIEDASHSIGAMRYEGAKQELVGGCQWSDITVFSLHPVKIITSGEGGVALTNTKSLATKMQQLRSHGIVRSKELQQSHGPWYYQQTSLGCNYRMTDIQAALAKSQLSRIEEYIFRRNELAERYTRKLADLPLLLPSFTKEYRSSWHLYVIQLKDHSQRLSIFTQLRAMGIGVNVHYIPVYHQPYYQQLGFTQGLCPAAEQYYKRAITIPLFPAMSKQEQNQVIQSLRDLL